MPNKGWPKSSDPDDRFQLILAAVFLVILAIVLYFVPNLFAA